MPLLTDDSKKITCLSGPVFILWEITRQCDLYCKYCYTKDGNEKELSDFEAEEVALELVQLRPRHVFFSGGEPLKRENLLQRLVQRLTSKGIQCGLMTDGSLVEKTNANWLKEQMFEIQVGLDGADSKTHDFIRGYEGSFARAVEALELLKAGHAKRAVVMALHKATKDQVLDIAELCVAHGASTLYLPWLARVGRAHTCPELFLQPHDRLTVVEQIVEAKLRFGERLGIVISDPLSFARRMVDNRAPNATLQIRPDGVLTPLQWLPWTVGHVREGIKECWSRGLGSIWINREVVKSINEASSLDDLWQRRISDQAEWLPRKEED